MLTHARVFDDSLRGYLPRYFRGYMSYPGVLVEATHGYLQHPAIYWWGHTQPYPYRIHYSPSARIRVFSAGMFPVLTACFKPSRMVLAGWHLPNIELITDGSVGAKTPTVLSFTADIRAQSSAMALHCRHYISHTLPIPVEFWCHEQRTTLECFHDFSITSFTYTTPLCLVRIFV